MSTKTDRTPKVRTPRDYKPTEHDYEQAPTAMVIGGKLVEFLAHPSEGMCCRAVFPVNKTTVLKVQVVDEGDWAGDQNRLECEAWEMVKGTKRAKRFCRTWGYEEQEISFSYTSYYGEECESTIVLSWCFQERVDGESLGAASGDDAVQANEEYQRLGRWVERRFKVSLGDWRGRQARFVKGDKGFWKVHDFAEMASDDASYNYGNSSW